MRLITLLIVLVSPVTWATSLVMPLPEINVTSESLEKYGFCVEITDALKERKGLPNMPFYLAAIAYPAKISDSEFGSSAVYFGNQYDYLFTVENESTLREDYGAFRFALVPASFEKAYLKMTYWGRNRSAVYIFKLKDFYPKYRIQEYTSAGAVKGNCQRKYHGSS